VYVCVCARVCVYSFKANSAYYILSLEKKILLVVTLNLGAPRSHMPGTIFLQRCVIKGRTNRLQRTKVGAERLLYEIPD